MNTKKMFYDKCEICQKDMKLHASSICNQCYKLEMQLLDGRGAVKCDDEQETEHKTTTSAVPSFSQVGNEKNEEKIHVNRFAEGSVKPRWFNTSNEPLKLFPDMEKNEEKIHVNRFAEGSVKPSWFNTSNEPLKLFPDMEKNEEKIQVNRFAEGSVTPSWLNTSNEPLKLFSNMEKNEEKIHVNRFAKGSVTPSCFNTLNEPLKLFPDREKNEEKIHVNRIGEGYVKSSCLNTSNEPLKLFPNMENDKQFLEIKQSLLGLGLKNAASGSVPDMLTNGVECQDLSSEIGDTTDTTTLYNLMGVKEKQKENVFIFEPSKKPAGIMFSSTTKDNKKMFVFTGKNYFDKVLEGIEAKAWKADEKTCMDVVEMVVKPIVLQLVNSACKP
ncbi:uncharacterized protein LOC119689314 [Teleopsis dalmanni]|uniref:uncharacterized protein LOC119689314 n=1 Tax=Teleopsis dalmanni TaxID=139649 RepID=UPI0018CE13DC|nr:uncharacterized protein LOC119689314 [Teleopsis dalmanni]XP_037960045.1 uncharacterized protein LOC119689314 [Teleopsis dalmanni]